MTRPSSARVSRSAPRRKMRDCDSVRGTAAGGQRCPFLLPVRWAFKAAFQATAPRCFTMYQLLIGCRTCYNCFMAAKPQLQLIACSIIDESHKKEVENSYVQRWPCTFKEINYEVVPMISAFVELFGPNILSLRCLS